MQGSRWKRKDRQGGRRSRARRFSVGPASLLACLAVVAAGTVVFAPAASAVGNGKFALDPVSTSRQGRPFFTPVLSPGVESTDKVAVENLTQKPLTLNLYAADAYTTSTGGFALEPSFKPRLHMGAWIHLPVNSVKVPPRSGYLVPITYEPPANVAPGDYAGGIVAVEQQGAVNKKGPVRTQVLQAIGVAVYGRIRGPLVPRVTVTAVSVTTTRPLASQFGGGVNAKVTYSVTNTGNENVKPAVTVSLAPLFGSGTKDHVQMPQILPGSTVTFTHNFHYIVPRLVLSATVTARALGAVGTGSSTAIIIPWALVAIVVLLILLAFFYRRRRRRRASPESQSGGAGPNGGSPGTGDATPAAPTTPVETGVGARGP
ncbi:MAG: WxL protein peptidoglycan domain-containing protein [Acidimicrobiales bacterium]